MHGGKGFYFQCERASEWTSGRSIGSYYPVASECHGSDQALYWLSYLRISPLALKLLERSRKQKRDTRNRGRFATRELIRGA